MVEVIEGKLLNLKTTTTDMANKLRLMLAAVAKAFQQLIIYPPKSRHPTHTATHKDARWEHGPVHNQNISFNNLNAKRSSTSMKSTNKKSSLFSLQILRTASGNYLPFEPN
jgi:hypothetical protein